MTEKYFKYVRSDEAFVAIDREAKGKLPIFKKIPLQEKRDGEGDGQVYLVNVQSDNPLLVGFLKEDTVVQTLD